MEALLTIEVDDEEFNQRFRHLLLQLSSSHSRILMRAIGLYMEESTDDKFIDERGEFGPWEALTAATENRRRVGPGGVRTIAALQDTGTLRRGITSLVHVGGADLAAEIGSPVFYSVFHQLGAPRANIPVRDFLYVDEDDQDRILDLTGDYILRAMQ